MVWQDIVFAVGGFAFTIALLPSVFGKNKPDWKTSAMTAFFLWTYVSVYISYGLWLSLTAGVLSASTWTILFVQARRKNMNEYDGHWIATSKVKHFYFLDPKPEDILIEDIAHALSLQCRFGGHTAKFYSVAEHSVRVANELYVLGLGWIYALAGLFHDAEEAYLPDIPRPVKHMMPEAKKIYAVLSQAIHRRFGVSGVDPIVIKEVDNSACLSEAKYFGIYDEKWADLGNPLSSFADVGWSPSLAEKMFLESYKKIKEGIALDEETTDGASDVQETDRGGTSPTRSEEQGLPKPDRPTG